MTHFAVRLAALYGYMVRILRNGATVNRPPVSFKNSFITISIMKIAVGKFLFVIFLLLSSSSLIVFYVQRKSPMILKTLYHLKQGIGGHPFHNRSAGLQEHLGAQFTVEMSTYKPSQNSPETLSFKDAMLKEQTRRHGILNEACESLNMSSSVTQSVNYRQIIVIDAHKILFNFIPKVSCTTWKRIWGSLRNKNKTGFDRLHKYTAKERNIRLKSYRKILFVREPLSRLLSMYQSKFCAGLLYNRPEEQRKLDKLFGRDIVKRYRNETTFEKSQLLNITFIEFIRYITDLGNGIRMVGLINHWLPQYVVSSPCRVKYDFIGRFENLAVEGPYVLQWLGVDHLVKFARYHESHAAKTLSDYYKDVPFGLLEKLGKYYEKDYKLFEYSIIDTLGL